MSHFHPLCFSLLTSAHHFFIDTADGSFVETSCGPVAHELKKRYDRFIKTDKDNRSPYAITAFVNQHGKQMYRVGCVRCPFTLARNLIV